MDDIKQVLHRAVDPVQPSRDGLEHVRDSVRRRRLRHRISAGAVGLTLAAGAISFAVLAFIEEPVRHPGPLPRTDPTEEPGLEVDVSDLVPSWSAEIPDAVAVSDIVQDDERVYVPTAEGAVAFLKACDDPCIPVWKADLLEGDPPAYAYAYAYAYAWASDTYLAVDDGVVAISFEGRLAVFAADCRTDGGTCEPLWKADLSKGTNGYRAPVISEGIVKVTSSVGEMPDHRVTAMAFEAECRTDGGVCDPAWTGDLGIGTAYFPAPAAGGVFYQQVGDRLLGSPLTAAPTAAPASPTSRYER